MRFSDAAYSKLYPRKNDSPENIESAVESFKPTENFQNEDFRHLNSDENGEEVIGDGDAGDGQSIVE